MKYPRSPRSSAAAFSSFLRSIAVCDRNHERRRTQIPQRTLLAQGPTGDADLPAVEDEEVREQRPFLSRNELYQILLDLHRIGIPREAEPEGHTCDVRVD